MHNAWAGEGSLSIQLKSTLTSDALEHEVRNAMCTDGGSFCSSTSHLAAVRALTGRGSSGAHAADNLWFLPDRFFLYTWTSHAAMARAHSWHAGREADHSVQAEQAYTEAVEGDEWLTSQM